MALPSQTTTDAQEKVWKTSQNDPVGDKGPLKAGQDKHKPQARWKWAYVRLGDVLAVEDVGEFVLLLHLVSRRPSLVEDEGDHEDGLHEESPSLSNELSGADVHDPTRNHCTTAYCI